MKAISKIIAVVSLTVISFSGSAQETPKQVKNEQITKVVVSPTPIKRNAKAEVKPTQTQTQRPVRQIVPAERSVIKKEMENE